MLNLSAEKAFPRVRGLNIAEWKALRSCWIPMFLQEPFFPYRLCWISATPVQRWGLQYQQLQEPRARPPLQARPSPFSSWCLQNLEGVNFPLQLRARDVLIIPSPTVKCAVKIGLKAKIARVLPFCLFFTWVHTLIFHKFKLKQELAMRSTSHERKDRCVPVEQRNAGKEASGRVGLLSKTTGSNFLLDSFPNRKIKIR